MRPDNHRGLAEAFAQELFFSLAGLWFKNMAILLRAASGAPAPKPSPLACSSLTHRAPLGPVFRWAAPEKCQPGATRAHTRAAGTAVTSP
jgi:hypothetical protein